MKIEKLTFYCSLFFLISCSTNQSTMNIQQPINKDTIIYNNYLNDGELYAITSSQFDQLSDLKVINDSLYRANGIPGYNSRTIGSDLYSFHCSSCHSYYPKTKKEFNVDELSTLNLYNTLLSKAHKGWFAEYGENIDSLDLEHIIQYMKGSNKKIMD